ncbi:MAG: hypothetical protein NTV07_00530 [Candidatus Omnitrophica bacterium]|nr:hypothetical protein [Candidatus Omnitrophota bacterium]
MKNPKPEIVFICLICFCGIALAEDFTYSSKGKRDPFIPLIGAGAIREVKEAVDIKSIEDVTVEGILYDEKGGSTAIINGVIVREADQLGIVLVDKIEPKKVVLVIDDKRFEIPLAGEKKE